MLEDILDGLFHIAKADGVLHEREGRFLHRIAEIFRIERGHYQSILARHVDLGEADPYVDARHRARQRRSRRSGSATASWSPTTIPTG